MRPELSSEITVASFQEYYWLKTELQQFCRTNGLSAAGSKLELTERIEMFLQTGEIRKPARTKSPKTQRESLSLNTVITENHRCSQQVRAFFVSAIGKNFIFLLLCKTIFAIMQGKHIEMLSPHGMRRRKGKRIQIIREKLLLHLNIIGLYVIFLQILTTEGKAAMKRFRHGIRLRNCQAAMHINVKTQVKNHPNGMAFISISQLNLRILLEL